MGMNKLFWRCVCVSFLSREKEDDSVLGAMKDQGGLLRLSYIYMIYHIDVLLL